MKRPWILVAVGIVLGESMSAVIGWWALITVAIYMAACFAFLKNKREAWMYVLILLACITGIMKMQTTYRYDDTGIVSDIQYKDEKTTVTSGHTLVYIDGIRTDLHIGNEIKINGDIEKMDTASNPGQYDYSLYYKSKGIYYRCFADDIEILNQKRNLIKDTIFHLRNKSLEVISTVCEENDAGFLRAALLGDKSTLKEDMYDLYRRNGIAHLLAISGLHVAILGLGLYTALRKLGLSYKTSGIIGTVLLIIYGMLTGGSISTVRAIVMLMVVWLAGYEGRTYDLISSACLTASILLTIDPYELYNGGFQLSFAAVLAIGGPATYIINQFRVKHVLIQSAIISATVQLLTIPIIAYHYFEISLYGAVLNLIVIPLMTYVVWAGWAVLICGYISIRLALIPAGSVHYILMIYTYMCNVTDKLPSSGILIGRPSVIRIILYYIFAGISIYLIGKLKHGLIKKHIGYITVIATVLICFLCLYPFRSGMTRVDFIDVGQGDGICISEADEVITVDGGSSSDKHIGEYTIKPYLKSRAISQINYAILTHADSDHTNGIMWLVEDGDIEIEKLILPYTAKSDVAYEDITDVATKHDITIIYMKAGDVLNTEKGTMTCLSPQYQSEGIDINEQSLVYLYDRDSFSMILTGDAGIQSEETIMELEADILPHKLTVLKAGHHGSSTSTGEEWAETLDPHIAILSYGQNNNYGHPHKETVDILKKYADDIYRTAEDGCISIYTDGQGIRVNGFCDTILYKMSIR